MSDDDPANVKCEGGGEGCTPGYWKQSQHFDSWTAPFTPDTLFLDVFEDAFPGMTLLDVLELGGAQLEALGRHTVAALLNAASPGVSYDLFVNGVIEGFNDVFPDGDVEGLKNSLDYFNEQGCPLDYANARSKTRHPETLTEILQRVQDHSWTLPRFINDSNRIETAAYIVPGVSLRREGCLCAEIWCKLTNNEGVHRQLTGAPFFLWPK